MTFEEYCKLWATKAEIVRQDLHMTQEEFDRWQELAVRFAEELKPESIIGSKSTDKAQLV